MATAVRMQHVLGMNVSANRDLLEMGNTVKVIYKVIIKMYDENMSDETREQNRNNVQTNESRAIWLVYPTDTNARGFWLVKRTLGWKNFMLENFLYFASVKRTLGWKNFMLENFRYFALTTYCNTIGQSNNAISLLGFSLAGKRRVHVLIFSSIGR